MYRRNDRNDASSMKFVVEVKTVSEVFNHTTSNFCYESHRNSFTQNQEGKILSCEAKSGQCFAKLYRSKGSNPISLGNSGNLRKQSILNSI